MEETRKYSKFEWFFYLFFIPLLFTAILSGVILQFSGYDVLSKSMNFVRHIPVVKNWVPPDAKTLSEQSIQKAYEKQMKDLNDKLQKEKTNEAVLQNSLTSQTTLNQTLKLQIDSLKEQLAKKQSDAELLAAEVKTFSQMDPAKASNLLSALPDSQAKLILTSMKSDVEAAILEKMDPARAAQLLK